MQVFILFAVFAASQAAVLIGGASDQYRSEDGLGNYAFGYQEGHGTGSTFRKETGDGHGNVAGSYGLRDADGRVRVVNYVADAAGFRADVKTNEPGVEPKDPAHTAINKAAVAIAPAHYAAAPAVIPAASHHHYAAPLLHHAAPAAVHYAGHPAGGFAYSSAVGHHGIAHHGIAHHAVAPHHAPIGHYGYYY